MAMINSLGTKRIRDPRVWLLAGCLFLPVTHAAGEGLLLKTHFYSDNEGLFVQSPVFQWEKQMASDLSVSLQYSLDRVSIPPVRSTAGIPLPVDAVSGASRPAGSTQANSTYIKNRNQWVVAVKLSGLTATGYYSTENDYQGRLVSLGVDQNFNQKNTTLSTRVSFGWDEIAPLGKNEIFQKQNLIANLIVTQTLTPLAILRFGVDVSRINGFQSNPYRTVFIAGEHRLEVHPQTRQRLAVFAKLNQYLWPNQGALWTDYRYYRDDWGIQSHTVNIQFFQFLSHSLFVRYRYRYYRQSAANFYRKIYTTDQPYFSGDYKMMPFTAHLFGFKFSLELEEISRRIRLPLLENARLEMKYERYFTSEKYAANIFELGLDFSQ